MEKLEGHLSPKASQEKRGSFPGDYKAEGQGENRRGRVQEAGPLAPGGPASPLGRVPSQMPALNRKHGLPSREFFSSHYITHKVTAINSADSLITWPPDSTSDWFSYLQRKL